MHFNSFISSFQYGIDMFLDSLYQMANYLVGNYFFIIFLGVVLFSSLFFFFWDTILDIFNFHIKNNIDDYLDSYKNFDRFQRMKFSWYNNNRELVYNSKFDSTLISRNVRSMVDEHLSDEKKSQRDVSYVRRYRYYDKNTGEVPDIPEWVYNNPDNTPISLAEEKELTDIINNF